MPGPIGFANAFTSGEVCEDAYDRVDLQPVAKGCAEALNLVPRIVGPLSKRRGFWLAGALADQAHQGKLVPFVRSVTDRLILAFQNLEAWAWNWNGTPLIDAGTGLQLHFATPYTDEEAALGLRYKQVGDVIYFTHATGLAPHTLTRAGLGTLAADWTFTDLSVSPGLLNGPFLPENITTSSTITLASTGGAAFINDFNVAVHHIVCVPAGAQVSVAASAPIFDPASVGAQIRFRANGASISTLAWEPGLQYTVGQFVTSVGNVYNVTLAGADKAGSNPPVQLQGFQSDGANGFTFLTDGAGVLTITGYVDATHVTATCYRPGLISDSLATSFWALSAWSPDDGWPTAWPEVREERLAMGATAQNLDFADLTQTAGFYPGQLDYTPGTGLGQVIDTNAIRVRVGKDGGQILGFYTATYLVAMTTTGEHIIAGSVLDEPLSPLPGVTVKQLSGFGSADVQARGAHKGLLYVERGGMTLREIVVDTQQIAQTEDHSYLAYHLELRGFSQLAWTGDPDNALWVRLADGGLACFTYHQEQAVKGWTTAELGGGMTAIDMVDLPGADGISVIWVLAQQTVAGVTTTYVMFQAQVADSLGLGLYMDGAELYQGAPANVLAGLPATYDGQAVDVLDTTNGSWWPGLVVAAGAVTLPNGATTTSAQVGFTYPVKFRSLKLDLRIFNGSLLTKQRIAGAIVDVLTAECTLAGDDSGDPASQELIVPRRPTDVPGMVAHRIARRVNVRMSGDEESSDRDPRIVITEETPYEFALYAIRADEVAYAGT